MQNAIELAFEETDKNIVEVSNKEEWMNGSTGVVALISDHSLYIANVGDSEACLVSEEKGDLHAENLTTPHKANDPTEKKRIEDLGGLVFFGRVFGQLAVSRSFGDSKFKKPLANADFVSCLPSVQVHQLNPKHKFLVLACDGLWDVMDHQNVADFIYKRLIEGKTVKEIATDLVAEAIKLKTEDNVTVIIVLFKWKDHPIITSTPQTPSIELN